jgi:hypothetical protein
MKKLPTDARLHVVDGGVGDFLQFMPYMLTTDARFAVIVHFKGAKELLRSIKVRPEKLYYYTDDEDKRQYVENLHYKEALVQCPRMFYMESSPFKKQPKLFNNDKKTIGVHLNGSALAFKTHRARGMTIKTIPPDIVHALSDYNVIVFGLPDDIAATQLKQSDSVKFVCYLDIAKSLSYVEQCDDVVAADSSIKTMSSMLKIPTFVWMADHVDEFRDGVFINQYVKDGIMDTFRFANAFSDFDEGIRKTKQFLEKVFKHELLAA